MCRGAADGSHSRQQCRRDSLSHTRGPRQGQPAYPRQLAGSSYGQPVGVAARGRQVVGLSSPRPGQCDCQDGEPGTQGATRTFTEQPAT